MLILLAIKLSS